MGRYASLDQDQGQTAAAAGSRSSIFHLAKRSKVALGIAFALSGILGTAQAVVINSPTPGPVNLGVAEPLTVTATGSITSVGANGVQNAGPGAIGIIDNAGTITTDLDGISLNGNSIAGGINNQAGGQINATNRGIALIDSQVAGAISNGGSIQVTGDLSLDFPEYAIGLDGNAAQAGGIHNTGSINSTAAGIRVFNGAQVTGDITNSGTIDTAYDAISIDGGSAVGNITNSNTLTAGGSAIFVGSNAAVNGAITNTSDMSTGYTAISVSSDVTGLTGIENTGTLDASYQGIDVGSNTLVSGDIRNDGLIQGVDVGILLRGGNSATQLINDSNGVIDAGFDGIYAFNGNFGTVTNDGQINATNRGIALIDSQVAGAISNGGSIQVTGDPFFNFPEYAIGLNGNAAQAGGIHNTGSINSTAAGIRVFDGAQVTGDITNSGSLTGNDGALVVSADSTVQGMNGILNTGDILGAVEILGDDGLGGGIDLVNSGLLDIGGSESVISGDFIQDALGELSMELLDFSSYTGAPLQVDMDAMLDGLLTLSFLGTLALPPETRFTLIEVGGNTTGEFSNYADGDLVGSTAGQNWFIDYTAEGDVELFSQEASAPAALGLMSLGLLLGFKRRRITRAC